MKTKITADRPSRLDLPPLCVLVVCSPEHLVLAPYGYVTRIGINRCILFQSFAKTKISNNRVVFPNGGKVEASMNQVAKLQSSNFYHGFTL